MRIIARRTPFTLGLPLLASVLLLGMTMPALGVPKERDVAPNARIEDADGHALEIKSLKGKPVIIVYDDRTSAPKSEAYRRELVKLLKSAAFASKVTLLVVGDVSPYDFWPARGTVKDAVRKESQKQGTTVYCDWTGGLRSAYKLKTDVTSVVMVGKDARVRFAFEGVPAGAEQTRLVDALRAEVEAP
jgi:predicted transcriptional regulator